MTSLSVYRSEASRVWVALLRVSEWMFGRSEREERDWRVRPFKWRCVREQRM